jgi:hypothetical protein
VLNCVQLVGRQVLFWLRFRGCAPGRQVVSIVGWWYYTELTMLPTFETEPAVDFYAIRSIRLNPICTSFLRFLFRVISATQRSRGQAVEPRPPSAVRLPLDSRRSESVEQCKGSTARSLSFS